MSDIIANTSDAAVFGVVIAFYSILTLALYSWERIGNYRREKRVVINLKGRKKKRNK